MSTVLLTSVGYASGSDGKEPTRNAGDLGLIPGSGRSPGGGHGYPLQYIFQENPMDRGAWRVVVHGAAKSQTQLNDWHTHHTLTSVGQVLFVFTSIIKLDPIDKEKNKFYVYFPFGLKKYHWHFLPVRIPMESFNGYIFLAGKHFKLLKEVRSIFFLIICYCLSLHGGYFTILSVNLSHFSLHSNIPRRKWSLLRWMHLSNPVKCTS